MILSAIIDTITVSDGSQRGKQVPPPGLRDALETLHYLADRGNHFAKRGYEEVHQTWSHLSAYLQQPQHVMDAQAAEANARSSGTLATPVAPRIVSGSGNGSDTYSRASSAGDHTFASTGLGALLDTDLLGDFAHIWDGAVDQLGRTFPDGTGYDLGSTDGQHRLYPLYSNLDMDLTGGDMEDFTEFRRSVLNL
jgi:proline utilization trans-activator